MRTLIATLAVCLAALLGAPTASMAGQTAIEAGTLSCAIDKWDETPLGKDHKTVVATSRCVAVPDDPASPKLTEQCTGNYEYLPDGSWKGMGTCVDTYQGGGTLDVTWEEGSQLKEYTYKKMNGTGKYKGVTGSGTYFYDNLTDTLSGGRFKGTLEFP
jgi:hypothetical protein